MRFTRVFGASEIESARVGIIPIFGLLGLNVGGTNLVQTTVVWVLTGDGVERVSRERNRKKQKDAMANRVASSRSTLSASLRNDVVWGLGQLKQLGGGTVRVASLSFTVYGEAVGPPMRRHGKAAKHKLDRRCPQQTSPAAVGNAQHVESGRERRSKRRLLEFQELKPRFFRERWPCRHRGAFRYSCTGVPGGFSLEKTRLVGHSWASHPRAAGSSYLVCTRPRVFGE